MKKIFLFILCIITCIILLDACNDTANKITEKQAEKTVKKDSSASCTPTIKDPNNAKPMALMMRIMAAQADSMHSLLLRGEFLDSTNYPFLRFYLVEPTDPKVLEPQFFENARLFQKAHQQLFAHPKEQKKYYNLLINSCIKCHESYCSGPLKRIRKFPI